GGHRPPLQKSVDDLQAELYASRVRCQRRDQSRRRADCGPREHDGIRRPKIRVIQRIEEFRSELQIYAFSDWSLLHDREIESLQVGPAQRPTSQISPRS